MGRVGQFHSSSFQVGEVKPAPEMAARHLNQVGLPTSCWVCLFVYLFHAACIPPNLTKYGLWAVHNNNNGWYPLNPSVSPPPPLPSRGSKMNHRNQTGLGKGKVHGGSCDPTMNRKKPPFSWLVPIPSRDSLQQHHALKFKDPVKCKLKELKELQNNWCLTGLYCQSWIAGMGIVGNS